MKRIFLTILLAFPCLFVMQNRAAAATICANGAPNLVANCGFETGDFTSWTLSGNDVPIELNLQYGVEGVDPVDGISPNNGSFQAFFADLVSNSTTISQTIATTAGKPYEVSFYLAQDTPIVTPYSNSLIVSFGGGPIDTLTAIPVEAYTHYIAFGYATSSSTQVSFTLGNDLGEFLLDDVSVVPGPEPASWFMMAGAAAFLAFAGWRRNRLAAVQSSNNLSR